MLEAIKRNAMRDGNSEAFAKIIVGIFEDKEFSEIAKDMGFKEDRLIRHNVKQIFAKYGVKSRSELIVKCAPYIKGELVCTKNSGSGQPQPKAQP